MFTAISEYSLHQDVSFARNEFFHGRTRLLIVTERWMFYNRFRIRGVQKLIFYGPPSHAGFYPELLKQALPMNTLASHQEKKIPVVTLVSDQNSLELERLLGTVTRNKLLLDKTAFALTL